MLKKEKKPGTASIYDNDNDDDVVVKTCIEMIHAPIRAYSLQLRQYLFKYS